MDYMKNQTQLDRYKRLTAFINQKFKENIQIEDIEEVSFYENLIFEHPSPLGRG